MTQQDEIVQWIIRSLRKHPHLTQAGLARALGRSKAAVTYLVTGKRRLTINEIPVVEAYLGEPAPVTKRSAAGIESIPISGVINRAWHEPGRQPKSGRAVLPILDASWTQDAQIAYEIGENAPAWRMITGDVLIAVSTAAFDTPRPDDLVIVTRRRAGLETLVLAELGTDKAIKPIIGSPRAGKDEEVITAVVVEVRLRLA